MKQSILCAIFLIIQVITFAQTDTALLNKMKKEYQEFVIEETNNFEKFKEERDKEFTELLKKDWENFKLSSGQIPMALPGPKEIPTYNKISEIVTTEKLSKRNLQIIESPISEAGIVYSRPVPLPEVPISKKDYENLSINFYGKIINVIYPKNLKNINIDFVSESNIANYWERVLETDYYRVVSQLLEYKNNNDFNDWAFYLLNKKFSESISHDSNSAKLLTWFLLSKSGYKIKVGYETNKIYLLVPTVNTIYNYSYFVFDNLKYYIFENGSELKTIYTYPKNYPEANRIMNFNIYKTPILGAMTNTKKLSFEYDNKKYEFDINYSRDLIDFYNDYPQGEIQIFFNAGISSLVKESLRKNILPIINGLDEMETANFLLAFVQLAFDYETDQEQFGYEKFFFPEEIFHYRAADCEDRSVFFAFLVNEFLRLPVVALNYPGHIATAVKFNNTISGSYYLIDKDKYVVCDPTYINAPVGACMPDFIKSEVNIIKLKNSKASFSDSDKIWKEFLKKGFIKTNYSGDILYAEDDNVWYLSGLIEDELVVNNDTIVPNVGVSMAFIIKTNNNADILQLELLKGNGLLMPIGIAYAEGKIYLSGYFSETVSCGNQQYTNDGSKELFMACWNKDFNLLWLRTSGLVHEIETANMFFAANFDKQGNFLGYEKIDEQSFNLQNPLIVDTTNNIKVFGKFQATEYQLVKSNIYKSKDSYEFAKLWDSLTQDYKKNGYENSICAISALLAILNTGNIDIEGKEILAAALTMNQEFSNQYPETFNKLQLIKNIKSENEIITLNFKSIANFGDIMFNDKSIIKIENINSQKIDMFVVSGIYFNSYQNLYEINKLSINNNTGAIEIFYDMNLENEKIYLNKNVIK